MFENCTCSRTPQTRRGFNIPITGGSNRVMFYDDETEEESSMPNKKYVLFLSPQDVEQYGITNVVKYADGFSFDAGFAGTFDYQATTAKINKK